MSPKIVFFSLSLFVAGTVTQLKAQDKSPAPGANPSPSSGPNPAPSTTPPTRLSPKFTDQQLLEMAHKLQERTGAAAGKVMTPIQKGEIEVNTRYAYFHKPERLDPRAYASKDEIATWQSSLAQFKSKEDDLEKLYVSADSDLGNALIEQQITPRVAEGIKKTLIDSFPWAAIKVKTQLMHDYIAAHGEMLSFYARNWGTWKSEPGEVQFDNPQLASTYKGLKSKIEGLGQRIEKAYRDMTAGAK